MTHPLRTLLYELFVEPIVGLWQERWRSPLPVLAASPSDGSAPPATTSDPRPEEGYEHCNL